MKPIRFVYNGLVLYGYAEQANGLQWFHIAGQTFSQKAEVSDFESSQGEETIDPSNVKAPMPGKIMKIHVTVGQELKAGSDVLAMEAMKMEYLLQCARDVKVKSINCQEGQQVELGQQLVDFEVLNG